MADIFLVLRNIFFQDKAGVEECLCKYRLKEKNNENPNY
jgi:hypothetical protein